MKNEVAVLKSCSI